MCRFVRGKAAGQPSLCFAEFSEESLTSGGKLAVEGSAEGFLTYTSVSSKKKIAFAWKINEIIRCFLYLICPNVRVKFLEKHL